MNNTSLSNIIKEKANLLYLEFLKSVENIKVIGILNILVLLAGSIVFYMLSSIILTILSKKYKSFREVKKPVKKFIFYILFSLLWEEIPGGFAGFMANISLFIALIKLWKILDYFIVDVLMVRHYRTDVLQIFRDLIKAIIWIVMGLILLKTLFGFSIKDIAVTSAVLTAAIGFALQDTLVNLIAGISIIAEKSFKIGDVIEIKDGEIGSVTQINWRTTRIKNRKNQIIIIPNKELSSAKIIHHSCLDQIGRIFTIGLPYDIPPAIVKKEILELLKNFEEVLKDPEPEILLGNFKDFFIEYNIRFFITDIKQALYIEDKIKTSIWYMLKRNGINIPYPVVNIIKDQPALTPPTEIYVNGENLINYLKEPFKILKGEIIIVNINTRKKIASISEGTILHIDEEIKMEIQNHMLMLTPNLQVEIEKIRTEELDKEKINSIQENKKKIIEKIKSIFYSDIEKEKMQVSHFMNIDWGKWK